MNFCEFHQANFIRLFPSPCGEEVMKYLHAIAAPKSFKFPSPCGEEVMK